MSYSRRITTFAFLLSTVVLTACGGNKVKDTLGLSRSAPDEFRVVSRPPLSVPPQFTLRPPTASDESPNNLPASKQAESLVLGKSTNSRSELKPGNADTAVIPVTASAPTSNAESRFLQQAGADKADPMVRDKIVEERTVHQQEQEDDSWWNVFSSNPAPKDPLVNAKKESQRIQKNDAEGKPVTEGDTPEVKARDTGVLGRIFGY